jgi:uncharacterized protein YbaR (Trm112 family)
MVTARAIEIHRHPINTHPKPEVLKKAIELPGGNKGSNLFSCPNDGTLLVLHFTSQETNRLVCPTCKHALDLVVYRPRTKEARVRRTSRLRPIPSLSDIQREKIRTTLIVLLTSPERKELRRVRAEVRRPPDKRAVSP